MKIVFMGTPGFAVPSLDIIFNSGYEISGVVTVPDKPVGRGQIIKFSPVKEYALKQNLKILQPVNLKDPEFKRELEALKPDLIVVVAFRMLPDIIWKMPPLGTFNLHASLLPQYRGAAPINWAIINGEKETGVTTFFINETIDTGRILFSEKLTIRDDETAGELHDRLMTAGANLVLKTVTAIQEENCHPISQDQDPKQTTELNPAPKIFKEDCKVDWNRNVSEVYNFIRGLSPYPAAFTNLFSAEGERLILKIFKAKPFGNNDESSEKIDLIPGTIMTDGRTHLNIVCNEGFISLEEVQLEGKRRMKTEEFLRGFRIDKKWRLS
jgi:methionyl-tRNA formyltransferase